MMKFHVRKKKVHLYGFSLSAENIEQLKQGNVVVFDMGEVDIPNMQIVLFPEDTEESIVEGLQKQGILPTSFNIPSPEPGETRVFRDLRERKSGGSGV